MDAQETTINRTRSKLPAVRTEAGVAYLMSRRRSMTV
jgi:hypothetical protein